MGSYMFRWKHSASEVYVTGTFDDWSKSVKLEAKDGIFEKTIQLPKNDEKVLYKFVVDGNWTTSTQAPQEDDGHGIYNNVLLPADIQPSPSAHIMPSTAPESTIAQLAAEQRKETPKAEDVLGAIETSANEPQQFSVNPIPAPNGDAKSIKFAPSTVKDDEELKANDEGKEQAFGVNPLPAINTADSSIKLAPGEKVPEPESISANNVNSRDVSPKTDPAAPTTAEQTEPTVSTDTEITIAPTTSGATESDPVPLATPAKSDKDKATPNTPTSTSSDKKAKRRSFWGKLREKFTGGGHEEATP